MTAARRYSCYRLLPRVNRGAWLLLSIGLLLANPCAVVAQTVARGDSREELDALLKPIPPKTPAEALASFEIHPGFRLDLVAHEPEVYDPIAGAFDSDGRLYVAEMRGYPYLPAEGQRPIGRVRRLEDTDADGTFDHSTVFADELLWPSGVLPYRGGVFVAAVPDLWYMRDDDGDGRADVRERRYTGFGLQNQQGMFNNLIWGLDHKIYGATSVNGGTITTVGDPNAEPIALAGNDFRFDPDTGRFEAISGRAQFGNTFDDWNNRFICSESKPIYHVVLPAHYLERNPHVAMGRALDDLAPGVTPVFRISAIEGWRTIRTRRRLAAGERPATSAGASHDVIDAAAGITIYRGAAFPAEYRGQVFIGGAQNNLIHRRTLEPAGASFHSRRADADTEFVRSNDNWFRPVNFVNAPDGTLYCLDMYREVLESIHIPLDVVERLDLTRGRNYGRIYRIAPVNFRPGLRVTLGQASTHELVAALASPHGWWRDTAHRLLHERRDRAAVDPLRQLLRSSESPQTLVHALWSLAGLDALSDADLVVALGNPSARVREHAVRLAEPRIAHVAKLADRVVQLAADADARVRFQVAFTLGELPGEASNEALARIAKRDVADRWMRAAVLSSCASRSDDLLSAMLGSNAFLEHTESAEWIEPLSQITGVVNLADAIDRIVTAAGETPAATQRSIAMGLGAGLARSRVRLDTVAQQGSPGAAKIVERWIAEATQTAADPEAPTDARITAIRLLAFVGFERAHDALAAILEQRSPPAVQQAAVQTLARFDAAAVPAVLASGWTHYPPSVRNEVIEALASRSAWLVPLLDAVERGQIEASAFSLDRTKSLREHADAAVRNRAERLFATTAPAERAEVLTRYQQAIARRGDPQAGEEVFRRECTVCHQLAGEGHQVGPNLALSRNRTPETLLSEILDPNRTVQPSYEQYVIVDDSGRTITGIVAAETPTGITLRRAEGVDETVLRTSIEQISSTGRSLMPEGLEQKIVPGEMSDLITFLLEVQYQIGTEPGIVQ